MEQGKKKILFVANSGPMHINKFHLPYISKLIEMGHKVEIACTDSKEVPIECRKYEVPFGLGLKLSTLIESIKISSAIIKNDYDVIYTHTAVPSAIIRLVFSKNNYPRTKIVYMAHGFHFSRKSSIISWLIYYPIEKLLSYKTDELIVINQEDYELATKKLKANSIHHINGIGLDKLFYDIKLVDETSCENSYKFFYAGDLNKNKNQKLLIEMMRIIAERKINAKLYLAGTGNEKTHLESLIKKYDLYDRVFLLGYISKEEVFNHLLNTDIVVASSLREGLPINIIESMSMGIPVVATDVRGHNDLIVPGVNGYLTEIDAYDLYKNVISIIENKKLYKEMSLSAIELSKNYLLDQVMHDICDVLLK